MSAAMAARIKRLEDRVTKLETELEAWKTPVKPRAPRKPKTMAAPVKTGPFEMVTEDG